MSEELIKVYDLRKNHSWMQAVQTATLETEEFGHSLEHGLYGSPEWWKAVEEGVIPTHTVEGLISRVFVSRHDWLEFEIDDGVNKTSWDRQVNVGNYDGLYRVGKRVKLTYVMVKLKKDWGLELSLKFKEYWGLEKDWGVDLSLSKDVVEIWIEP